MVPDDDLWSKLLHDVQYRSMNNLPNGSVLVLGDNNCGKTSLLARLQGIDDPKKGAGLEYHVLEINPDYKNGSYAYQLSNALPDVSPGESLRLGVWVLDGDPFYSPLISLALTPETLKHSVAVICCSMAEPWNIMETLSKWAKVLAEHLSSSAMYDNDVISECKEQLVRFWQEYVEPLDSSSHSDLGNKVPSMETDQFLLPLSESILSNNIGVPLIVVLTKCDMISSLEKDYDLRDEHFDFVQAHMIMLTFSYVHTDGAAIVYTNAKEGRNCDTLYKYILHRIYGFPFTQAVSVLERDSVFVPAGWDTINKIKILEETFVSVSSTESFEKCIRKPATRRTSQKEVVVRVEDENHFLNKVQATLNAHAPNNSTAAHRGQVEAQSKSVSQVPQPEGALAQFFNNLLIKKAGLSPIPVQPGRRNIVLTITWRYIMTCVRFSSITEALYTF
ncbi:dynein intermediate chain [Trichuris trichiura]|uniref:Dynein light intermediate chain n=1 Tax=Trichuris trichiura TaxID=36087 RepID=A0A077ZB19_TRITR|nr:dynein intermediate chain [Trichuris trichiura]